MKCPICNEDMEQGFIQGGSIMAWTKKVHKISLLPKEGEVMLWHNMLRPSAIPASICKLCKKIIVDYSEIKIADRS